MKQVKELKYNQIEKLKNLIKSMGFKLDRKKNSNVIFFSKGFRDFSLYSSDLKDSEFGLTISFNLIEFLKKHYKIKTKHSISLQELVYNQELSNEDAFEQLNWEVLEYYNFKDFDLYSFNDDLDFEDIYQVSIRGLSHIIVDDSVYEGELNLIKSLLSVDRDSLIEENFSKEFIDYMNSLNN